MFVTEAGKEPKWRHDPRERHREITESDILNTVRNEHGRFSTMPPRKTEGPEPGKAPYFAPANGYRRNGISTKKKPEPGNNTGRTTHAPAGTRPAPTGAPRLTGRGGTLVIVVFSLVGTTISHWVGVPAVPGVAFTLACLIAVFLVRPADLLSLSVSPPVAYFVALVTAEAVLAVGNEGYARALVLGLASRLAEVAPWLFLGTALVLVVGVFRGLTENLRDLGDQLDGRR